MTEPQPGKEFSIYVTHVDTDGPLLRVWGQIHAAPAHKIEQLIEQLNDGFKRGVGAIEKDTILATNTRCCALHEGLFYRAEVLRSVGGKVVVHFMDYGNTESVAYDSIRILNDTVEGIQLQALPAVVTDFVLAGVLPIDSAWDQSLVDYVKHTLSYREIKASVCSVLKNSKRTLMLQFNGDNFSEFMVNRRMARFASYEDLANIIDVPPAGLTPHGQYRRSTNSDYLSQPQVLNNYNNNFHQKPKYQNNQTHERQPMKNWRQQAPQQILYVPPRRSSNEPPPNPPRSAMTPAPKIALSVVNRVLKYRKYPVLVSFVEDGPLKFAVQPEENLAELAELMRQINCCPLKLLSEPPIPGSVCLGRYSRDGTLRRAVVRSVTDSLQAKVFYIDYGSSEILSHSDIYDLPVEFAHPCVFSIRFTLSNVKYLIVNDEMKSYFRELVEGKHLMLDVVPPEDSPLMQYGSLWDNGRNILEMLIAKFPGCTANWPELRPLNRGVKKLVHVCYVEACSKFFVQLDEGSKAVETLMTTLDQCIPTAAPVKPDAVKPGLKCLAHCNVDSLWYRAQVIRIVGNEVVVHYVDYGNNERIPMGSLRVVTGDVLTKIPALAIRCVLKDFQGQGMCDEVDNQFEHLVIDKVLEMTVLDHCAEGIVVNLMNKNVQPIVDVHERMRGIVQARNAAEAQGRGLGVQAATGRGRNEEANTWVPQDPPKKIRRDEDIQNQRQAPPGWINPVKTTQSHAPRNDRNEQNDWPSRDRTDPHQDRNNANRPYDSRTSANNSSRSKPSPPVSSRSERTPSLEKSWSDKDSDTSSRSGGRRGDRPTRGGGNRPPRNDYQRSPRDSENNETSHRSPRPSNPSNYPPGRSPRDFGDNNRRPTDFRDTRDNRRAPSSPSKTQRQQAKISPPNITLGAIKNCELTYVVSPVDFCVVLLPDYNELQGVMDKISEIYTSGGDVIPRGSIKPGLDCIAQFSVDDQWYRATVEEVTPQGAKVRFVDYANMEVVPFNNIKEIKEEVCKLPAQAIQVKLLAAADKIWDTTEIEEFMSALELKNLEAEFVGLDGKIYEVLLTVEGSDGKYVNEQYSNGADLTEAKEAARNRSRKSTQSRTTKVPPNYAPMSQKWKEPAIDLEEKLEAMVTWIANPHNFYCQSLKAEKDFRKMMHDIQTVYAGRTPVEEPLEVGTAVMAVFADDGALYRAEILALNKLRGNIVRYVDFGNCAMVESSKTYRVEKQFMEMPKQAFNCTLENVVPVNGPNWHKSNSHEINKLFNVEKLECCFHDVNDNKYTVGIVVNGKDLAGVLVERGLADFAVTSSIPEVEQSEVIRDEANVSVSEQQPVRIDISKLEHQGLRVKVSNVEGTGRFHVLLPSAGDCENGVTDFMMGKDPKVLPKLSKREVCLGSGCLVEVKGGWRRGVVISTSQSTGFDVRLIDTGAKLVIPLECMLALPPQLAVMQNQAVECYLKNVKSDGEVDKRFREQVEGKEVIIRVENVDNNRLAVSVFDISGQKVSLTSADPETISPLLPMPIIHSLNRVTISHINHAKSLYLQRVSDLPLLQVLLEELFTFYSSSGRPLTEIHPSQLCAAQSEDENWYRARIVNSTETGALVHYPDYGNLEEIPRHLLKHLEPQHMLPPQLALEVSLSVPLKGTEEDQSEALKPLILDQEFTVSLYHIRSTWITDLVDSSGSKISEKLASMNLLQEEEPKQLEIDPAEPEDLIVGGKYKIKVTHADNPGQFYMLRLRDMLAVDELQEKLQLEISSYDTVEGIPEENLFCAATYSADGLWYRAEVIDADDEIVTVRFVDFGNTDSITDKNGIKILPESMKSIKRYGIKCRLDLMPVGEEEWSEAACEKFYNMTTAEDFIDAVVIADGSPKRLELFIGEENIGDRLVEEKLGIKIHGVEDIELVHRELDPRSAFVSHINSPSEFWVQEEKFVADLETIADRFVVADMFPTIDDIQEGMLCVARFPEDQLWYRARVISHGDNGTNVIYVDYGNSAISTEIRQIPEDAAAIPPLSRKCCLPLPEGVDQWSEKACEEFSKIAGDGATVFILEVIDEGETSKVKLILDEKDISEELAELCVKPVTVIEERLSPLGEETSPNVVISHVVSPSEFWIQADYKMAELDAITHHLVDAQSFLPLNNLTEGTVCAAKFPEDEQWYRATILCHSESETEVLYIDYGNSAVTDELRALPEDLVKIPALSTCCSLKLPEDCECWSQGACEKFIELIADGQTMFEYEELVGDEPIVSKLCLNGQDVVEILGPLCEAKSVDVGQGSEDVGTIEEGETIPEVESNLDETSDSFSYFKSEICVKIEAETVSDENGEIIETETIIENVSSSTSGIEGTATSDQSSSLSKMASSPDETLEQPGELGEGITEELSVDKELTADDIVGMYTQPPGAPDNVDEVEGLGDEETGGKISENAEVGGDSSVVGGDNSRREVDGEKVVKEEGETDSSVDESKILDSEDRGRSITEMSGVDLSILDSDKPDESLVPDPPLENQENEIVLEEMENETGDLDEPELTEITETCQSDSPMKLKDLKTELTRVKLGLANLIEVSPASPKTPHSEKLVSGVVTDHRILEVEEENDAEVLSIQSTRK